MVHFVGAGPGAPDLITRRGAALLADADCIIYAGSLVNPALLGLAKADCTIYNSAEMTLEQVLDNVLEKAQQAGETLLSAVVSAAIKSAAYAVVYVVLFLLLLILLRLALTPLHLFTKLPVVHGVNAVLGGALGLVKGALLLFLVVWALQKWQLFITPDMVQNSFLLKFFATNSPMDLIAKL